ncbi:MAG: glycosyltransferase family 87 protein [Candidatus Limnocylindrales bacterium]
MTAGHFEALRIRAGLIADERVGAGWRDAASRLAIPTYLIVLGVFVAFRILQIGPWDSPGFDLHAYWSTRDGLDYSATRPGAPGAYLYSPAFAHAIAVVTTLPWPLFAGLWTAFVGCLLIWLAGRWAIVLLLLPPVVMSVVIGQVDLLIAAAIVLGFRWPAAWALPILTKVTPGVGLLWFAVRREWRSLGIALGATALIVAASSAVDLEAWLGWLGMLSRGQFPRAEDGFYLDVPLGFRFAIATLVVVWGARTDRRWTVPLAACLAMPTVWINSPTILVAIIPLAAFGARTPAGRWLRRGETATTEDSRRPAEAMEPTRRGMPPPSVRAAPEQGIEP